MPRNLGAIERPKDPRDILLGSVQAPVPIPSSYVPDVTWLTRNYQGETPFCGEHAGTHLQAILEHQGGTANRFTPRYGAIKIKDPKSPVYDGFSIEAGTTTTAIFKWLQKFGATIYEPLENDFTLPLTAYCDPTAVTPAEDLDAANHKIANYAFDALTFSDLCQAIYQSKAVILLIKCDDGFWGTSTPTFTTPSYGHFVVAYGYDETGLWIVDSAEPNNEFGFKHIDRRYITPSFFFESGTAVDAAVVAQEIVSTTAQVVQEVAHDTTDTPQVKEGLLQSIEEVVKEIETIL